MRIEAITVCVGYADFLKQVLPHNIAQVDHYVVVTSYEDTQTIDLCRDLSVECRPTDLFKKGVDSSTASFNKGRAIDWGLEYLEKTDWVLHLDADIYLPPQTRRMIEASVPEPSKIYGCDRVTCRGFDAWSAFISDPISVMQFRQRCFLRSPPFPLDWRLVLPDHEGYIPIGFFQLWNGALDRRYPVRGSVSGAHSDVQFALQWPRKNRELIEEVIVVHLESTGAFMGANWAGRTTPPFGPSEHHRRHHHHGHHYLGR